MCLWASFSGMKRVPSSSGVRMPAGSVLVRRGWGRVCSTMGEGFCGCWAGRVVVRDRTSARKSWRGREFANDREESA